MLSTIYRQLNHRIDWDSAECVTYSSNYYQRILLESWFTNLQQTPLNNCLQLPAPYKPLVDDINNRQTKDWPTAIHVQTLDQQKTDRSKRTNHCLLNNSPTSFTNNRRTEIRPTKDGWKRTDHCLQSSQPMTTRLNWPATNNITTSFTNNINDQSIYTTYWRYTNHLTLIMTFCSGCRNVSQCNLKHSVIFSGLHRHPHDPAVVVAWLLGSNHLL